jgi:hypothetical protein
VNIGEYLVNTGEYLQRQSRGKYSPIFTEPEENNCFSIITLVNIRETGKKRQNFEQIYWKLLETASREVQRKVCIVRAIFLAQ